MNPETARKWLEARRTKRQLEAALRDVAEEIENLEIGLLEQMGSDGITQLKIDGSTISQVKLTKVDVAYREQETTDEGYERTCDELEAAGLGHLVKRRFFHQSVQSWVKQGGDIELLRPIMRVTEIHQLRVRDL